MTLTLRSTAALAALALSACTGGGSSDPVPSQAAAPPAAPVATPSEPGAPPVQLASAAGVGDGAPVMTVYKSPTCGCCSKWIDHVRANGFRVVAHDTANVQPIRTKLGVPDHLGSCHTAVVGDYVIEGHVPAEVIARALKERPEVTGLAVPGMPAGSPGMEGAGTESYDILAFSPGGKVQVYDKR